MPRARARKGGLVLRKRLVALVVAVAALSIPAAAFANPPDNRPPADRGNHGGNNHQSQSQSQQQSQQQSQSQSQCIIVIGLLEPATC
jgi:opacity protein-like surface antigen